MAKFFLTFPYTLSIEWICLFFALRLLAKQETGFFFYVKCLVVLTVVIETLGYFLHSYHLNNEWLYNIFFLPFEMYCIYTIIEKISSEYFSLQKWNAVFICLFALLYIKESFESYSLNYSSFTNSIFSGFVVLISCLYYYHLLKSEEDINITHHAPFWIISGLFFFYFGSTMCNLFYRYLASLNLQQNRPLRYFIFVILNFIFYSCWGYAFLCRKRQTISSSL